MTANHSPPMSTTAPIADVGDAEPAGRRRAEDDRRVAGGRGVEVRAHRPALPSSVPRSDASAARTEIPPVSDFGIRSVRRTEAWTGSTPDTPSTGPIRPIIAGASSGSAELSPNSVCPALTVRRFVPSRSSVARRSARLDSEIPSTDIIAAIPIAMPSAVSPVRTRLAREPARADPGEVDDADVAVDAERGSRRTDTGRAASIVVMTASRRRPVPSRARSVHRECRSGAAALPRRPGRG